MVLSLLDKYFVTRSNLKLFIVNILNIVYIPNEIIVIFQYPYINDQMIKETCDSCQEDENVKKTADCHALSTFLRKYSHPHIEI